MQQAADGGTKRRLTRVPAAVEPVGGSSALAATRSLICTELKKARQAKGWNQAKLGEEIDVSRFTINRLERGQSDLRSDVAKRIELALGVTGLVALVARRDQLADTQDTGWDRDVVMGRLLRTPNLHRVRIVLTDDLDVFELLEHNASLIDAQIEVIVPTVGRELELFSGDRPLYGHIEHQVQRLSELADGGDLGGVGTLTLYESPRVLFPAVVVRSPAGIECAYWPAVTTGDPVTGGSLPAVTSHDPAVTLKIDGHIDRVKRAASPIRKNQSLGVLDPVPDREGIRPVHFTRFIARGADDVELDEGEGLVVTLVLIHALCPRRGMGVRRRLLVHRAPDTRDRKRWSLVSRSVDDLDIRKARLVEEEPGPAPELGRSSSDPMGATLELGPYLEQSGGIPVSVFKEAAQHQLFATFGLQVAADRLRTVPLPPSLQEIDKTAGHPRIGRIIPHLFALELEVAHDPDTEPELSVLMRRADVEEWGYEDIEHSDDLNDFLASARDDGFLVPYVKTLGIARR